MEKSVIVISNFMKKFHKKLYVNWDTFIQRLQTYFCLFSIKDYLKKHIKVIRITILANDIYYTSPNIDKLVYHVSSVIMVMIGVFGISSNSVVLGAYFRNKKVPPTSCYITSLRSSMI